MDRFDEPRKIFVSCHRGIAPYLLEEISGLGFSAELSQGGVSLRGTLNDAIRLNLSLRCASQVLYSLCHFRCQNPDDLYHGVRQVPWENWIDPQGYFSVTSNMLHESIRSGMFGNLKVKDGVVDRIRQHTGHRPDSGAEIKGVVVHAFWRNTQAEVFLDTSGATLAKHGYRQHPGKAPMIEALASATLLASRWDRQSPLVNPMCGAGTIAIEAALMAANITPSFFRSQYAFQSLRDYDDTFYKSERALLRDNASLTRIPTIIASDHDSEAIQWTRANSAEAGIENHIQVKLCDFRETEVPTIPGVVFLNPEYGERLGNETQLIETYQGIGDFFKQRCSGYWGYVFTGNLELAKSIGLKPKRRIEFKTAKLDCRLFEFELYAGTRRTDKQAVNPPTLN